MRPVLSKPMMEYSPTVDVPETMSTGIGNKRLGDGVRAIVDYVVIEKTKSYVILRVRGFSVITSKRRR